MKPKTRKIKDNVVSLRGEKVRSPGVPSPDIISLAEKILERAKSGNLDGLAVSLYHSDDTHSVEFAGRLTVGTIGNVERLKAWMIELDRSP